MRRHDDGWWRADEPDAVAGTDYSFVLDGHDTALPDPRSLWQPEGVHGPSRVYDHSVVDRPAAARGDPL
jgi:maltooligosyltrehalose trehalohydrolase